MQNEKEAVQVLKCLIMDGKSTPLARGLLESAEDAGVAYVRVLDDKADEVFLHEIVQYMVLDPDAPMHIGRIVSRKEDLLIVEQLTAVAPRHHEDLRVPATFESFAYPISGDWQGRAAITARNVSCTGISFYSSFPFEEGERIEVAIPVVFEPLLLRCEVMGLRPTDDDRTAYAAKFVDMLEDEERGMREAVFNIQLVMRMTPRKTER